ncbi:hypothetical protein [Sphingomonas sp. Leaf339]|uniref:hypothetical protein n=1 Tax=Sphingomonas sp. Leaf339 TaxID=1736343 RepID=UPI0012E3EA6E|nr:hypothetical protein [Sphingomonas sp. Leaf339]
MTIYRLPGTRPYWSAPGCVIDKTARTEAMTICDRPARLTRLELMMPGWTATVNGIAVPVSKTDEIFQSIALPAGRAAVSFDYAPPHIRGAANAALVGLLLFLGQLMTIARSRRTMTAA